MFNSNYDLKYNVHILTTKTNSIQRNLKEKNFDYENNLIYRTIDNLKEIIENNIYYQLKFLKKIEDEKFQCLLKYIHQLLITFKKQYSTNQTSKLLFNTTKPQQQILFTLKKDKKVQNLEPTFEDIENNTLTTNRGFIKELLNKIMYEKLILPINNKINNLHVDVDCHAPEKLNTTHNYKKIFTSTDIFVSVNDYSPSVRANIMHRILPDKDDYPWIKKQVLEPVFSVGDRDIKQIKNTFDEITIPFSKMNKLLKLKKTFIRRIFTSRKNRISLKDNCTNPVINGFYPMFNKQSTLNILYIPYIHTFCGQTYDRSTSAYTSKKRSYHRKSSFRKIDQSTPVNILSRVAKKLDENKTRLTASNAVKYSTQKNRSSPSDIYIKLSDCQAACRRWTVKRNKRNQSDLCSSHVYSHYRHRKIKRPVCYRDFPVSLNALSEYNNTRKQQIKPIETKISVDIRKISCKNIHSKKKAHDSFICFGTGSVDFIDGPNGPILRLRQEESENDELNFGNGNGDEKIFTSVDKLGIHSSISNEVDDQSSSTLVSAHILRDENYSGTSCTLEYLLLSELTTGILYQSPSEATLSSDMIPAYLLPLVNCMKKLSIIQLAILPSNTTSHWKHRLPLNIRLIETNKNVQDAQKVILTKESDQNSVDKEENLSSHQGIVEKKMSITDVHDDTSKIINDIWDGIELSLYEHESIPSQIKTDEDQEEQNVTFVVDSDQNITNENLIDTEVPDDDEDDRDSNSTTMITSDLLINQSSEISFISNHINHQSITKNESIHRDNEIPYSDISLSTITPAPIREESTSEEASQSPDGNLKQSDNVTNSSLSMELPHQLNSPISTPYIDGIRSTFIFDQYQRIHESTVILSQEKQQTLDESHITVPACVQLRNSFEKTINETKHHTSQKSSHIDVDQNEEHSMKHSVSYPPLMTTSISKRSTSLDNSSQQSFEPLSIQTDDTIRKLDIQQQINEKPETSRIMTISRKITEKIIEDKASNNVEKQRRPYIKNQLSDFQPETHKVYVDQLKINTSPSLLTKTANHKQKSKSTIASNKYTRQKKFIRKKQTCLRPSWISSNENRPINNYSIKKSMNRTSIPLKQLKDPCQVLDLYTQFKRIHCKPYECVCTRLSSSCDIASCSFIKNAHICDLYLTQNNKI